jgi:hypothetical protein
MALSGQVGTHAHLTQTGTTVMGSTPSMPLLYNKSWDITNGTGVDQADQCVMAERTVATGANDDLDLSGVSLQNVFGQNIAFVKIKCICVEALSTNTTNLTVGAATSPFVGPFGAGTHTLILTPGDFYLIAKRAAAGWAVTPTSADILRITNGAGASASYRIILVGTTA